jgi:2-phosphosulfolactate phosphatase
MSKTIEISLSPALFPFRTTTGKHTTVVIDVLRFTTSVCAAFDNGVKAVIPVASLEAAKAYKQNGYLIAAERDGQKLDFANLGNSAFDYMNPSVNGKTIAYSTTNGTQAVLMAADDSLVAIGAFTNLKILTKWLIQQETDILILCSGWKNLPSIEDTLCAGALATLLSESGNFTISCDATLSAMDLWNLAENNLAAFIEKSSHRKRLRDLGVDDVIPYSLQISISDSVPVYEHGKITNRASKIAND